MKGQKRYKFNSEKEISEYLLENIPDRNPFFAFANMSETSNQDRVDIYLAQISYKRCQSPSPRQRVICDFYFTYWSRSSIFIHGFLSHLLGDGCVFANGYNKPLPHHPLSVFFQP